MSKYVTERIDNGDIKQTKKNIIAVDFDGLYVQISILISASRTRI